MVNVVDISEFQPSSKIDWATFSKNVDLLFCRVQYGSSHPDKEYANHAANANKHDVPFMTYAFPHFVSVSDARVEADDARSREDANSKGIVIDIEPEYDSNGNPVGITKLSYQVRLDGIKAYVDELRKKKAGKVGIYVAESVYESWGINTIINLFDFVWIPRYGVNPKYQCDLHQFTESGNVSGYSGNLDLSKLCGSKPLEYFTGKPINNVISLGVITMAANSVMRKEPNATSDITGNTKAGDKWQVTQITPDGWYQIGLNAWVYKDQIQFVWSSVVVGGFNQFEINDAFNQLKKTFPNWHMEIKNN